MSVLTQLKIGKRLMLGFGAFFMGLIWHLEASANLPGGLGSILYVLQHDWRGIDVQTAETMAFVTLSLCELFRAYTVRSEKVSLFRIGIFSNKWMQIAVAVSIVLLMLVCTVPFLQSILPGCQVTALSN